jgi:hypothetical protein
MSSTFDKGIEGRKHFFPVLSPLQLLSSRFWPFFCVMSLTNATKKSKEKVGKKITIFSIFLKIKSALGARSAPRVYRCCSPRFFELVPLPRNAQANAP